MFMSSSADRNAAHKLGHLPIARMPLALSVAARPAEARSKAECPFRGLHYNINLINWAGSAGGGECSFPYFGKLACATRETAK